MASIVPVASARAGEPSLRERLGQAWRWREIQPPAGVEVLKHVTAWGPGGIVAADVSSLRRFDGLAWEGFPGWEDDEHVQIEGLATVGAGLLVLTRERVLLLDEEGLQWEAPRPDGLRLEFPPIELPDVGIVLLGERELLRFGPQGLEPWRPAPPGGTPVSLAASCDSTVLCSTTTGIHRLDGTEWVALETPAGAEHGFEIARNAGREVLFLPGPGRPSRLGLSWTAAGGLSRSEWQHDDEIHAAIVTPDGRLILASKKAGLQAEEDGKIDQVPSMADELGDISAMCLTRADRLITLSPEGRLRSCDLTSRRWRSWLPLPDAEGDPNTVNVLARSRSGGLWVGTGEGVARWQDGEFVERHADADGEPLEGVTALAEDEYGSLWVGSGSKFQGVFQYDGQRWIHHTEEGGVGQHFVHAIRRAPSGDLWFLLLGAHDDLSDPGGVAVLTPVGWKQHGPFPGHRLDRRSYDVEFDAAGRPVLATYARVWRYDGGEWSVLGARVAADGSEVPTNGSPVWNIHVDGQRIWLGHGLTFNGLQYYEGGHWSEAELPGLSRVAGGDFATGRDGVLWISSNRGLLRWDGELGTVPTGEPGVPSRIFWPVLADGEGGVWLGARSVGLVRYRPDDVDAPVVRDVAAQVDPESGHWTATWDGVDAWNETPSEALLYRVRLDGGAWSMPTREAHFSIGRLGDGEHELEVQAIDLAGNRSGATGTTRIVIAAPWLRQWGPPLGIVLVAAAAGIGLVRSRRAQRRRELEERERAATEASERYYRTLVNRADMVLVCYGPGGGMEYISPYVEELTGRPPEAFLERSDLGELCVHPEDRALVAEFDSARRRGSLDVLQAELRVRHRDGSLRWLYCKQSPRQDEQGDLVGYDTLAYEITERKALEDALRKSEEQSRSIVETCNEGVWMLDTSYRTRYVNHRTTVLLGLSGEALRGRPMSDFLDEENLALVRSTFERSRTGRPAQCQVRLRTSGGGELWAILGASCINAPGGGEVGLLAMLADVTDRKHAEEAMQRSQRLESLGVLAGGVAHDFNNLLMVVQGNCELALRRLKVDSGAQEYLQKIEQASNRAAELCLQMLAYSGGASFELQDVAPGELVEGLERLLSSSVSKRVLVELEIEPDVPNVHADPTQLRQVLMNLVLNGSEAIGDGVGQVTVRVGVAKVGLEGAESELRGGEAEYVLRPSRPGRHVAFEVSDTGRGMDAETRERIFDPFFTTSVTGRGLGLAAVHGIVRGHGGAIAVATRPGRGSTLRVLLPAVPTPDEELPAAGEVVAEPRPGWRGAGTVLLVDDEPMVRLVTKDQLEALGFDVLAAETGREALELFAARTSEIRAVLLDVLLPDMNGVQVWRAIARLRPDVPVLLASGYSARDVASRFDGDGPHGFIQKPYRLSDLAAKLRVLLGA